MSRPRNPLLLGLLCLLVLSWGTCPCVLSRAFAHDDHADDDHAGGDHHAQGASSAQGKDQSPLIGCPCCRKKLQEVPKCDAPAKDDRPEKCPCCARGGANRDLPPAPSSDLDSPPAPEAGDLWYPEPAPINALLVEGSRWHLEATGPPTIDTLHGCPVGIVLLLN